MSEEKVLTLRGRKAVWAPGGGSGPIDPKRLPEGYPYKEQSETVIFEKQTEQFSEIEGHMQASLSNCALVTGQTIKVVWDDKEYECEVDGSLGMPAAGNFTALGVPSAASVDCPFLFVSGPDYITATAVTEMDTEHTISISELSETIHPMAPEFLPAGVGGGGMVVTVTMNDDGTYSADKTFAEVLEQIKAGNRVAMKTDGGPIGYYMDTYMFSENAGIVEFVLISAAMGTPTLTSVSLYKDNRIVGNMFTLTATQMGS